MLFALACFAMHCDRQATKLPNSCSRKRVCTWMVCAEPLISVWKVCNSKRYCETNFSFHKRYYMYMYKWDISAIWKRSLSFEQLDHTNMIEEVQLSLTLFSLLLIVHVLHTGMHRHASVIDTWQVTKSPFIYVLGTKPWQNVLGTGSRYTSVHITSTVKCSAVPLRSDL